ncbi:MAG: adenylosuccinate lyase, partial [Candidatus Thermoplasmatota archaeon]|nr:adenylosuccinate lyase [Candidatus Thermoplasmatota archaeon]
MPVSPLDYRYGREPIKNIWSRDGRHIRQIEVERALIWAHNQLGRVSDEHYEIVSNISNASSVTVDRVEEIERETKHDIMALTKAMAEAAGDAGWCIHLGATSNDIVDTAVALQIKDSVDIHKEILVELISTLCDLAERERDTVMLGRTHGQAAVPITFGLKIAVFLDEFRRHLVRLLEIRERICVGKFLGAVGTGAAQGRDARKLQELILTHLGLSVPLVTTQVVGRDRYIEWISWMANVATSVEKLLQEIRNLQRSEIAEVGEWFDAEKQVGSSTMAHKRNPITAENACGLARIVRSFVIPSYENALLWHERDLANSSAERFTLSHAAILLDDVMEKCNRVMSKCVVDQGNMRLNIDRQNGLVMAEKVMIELVDAGIPRDEAHEILRTASMVSISENRHLRDICGEVEAITQKFDNVDLDKMFEPASHIGVSLEL